MAERVLRSQDQLLSFDELQNGLTEACEMKAPSLWPLQVGMHEGFADHNDFLWSGLSLFFRH